MEAMKILAFLIALLIVPRPGFCEATGLAAAKPSNPRPRIVDLDFTEDEDMPEPRPKPAPIRPAPQAPPASAHAPAPAAALAAPAASHRWIYWTMGATAVAAGGLGWFWYHGTGEAKVTRSEQVFTDERP
jgi:hypothetical protein